MRNKDTGAFFRGVRFFIFRPRKIKIKDFRSRFLKISVVILIRGFSQSRKDFSKQDIEKQRLDHKKSLPRA